MAELFPRDTGGDRDPRRWGKRETIILYLTLHCHHQNDSRFKMGSDESRFNVSLTVRGKGQKAGPQITISEEKPEPKRNRTQVLVLTLYY